MTWENHSLWLEFVFLSYPTKPHLRVLTFLGVTLVYIFVITGNALIMGAIWTETRLHMPMYYMLGSLSGIEVCYTAVVVPHMMANILQSDRTIGLLACATQMTFLIGLGSADCFLLAAMAYDRYAAICHPLQYPLIMTLTLCGRLVVASVTVGLFLSFQLAVFIFSLPFCQVRGIQHFFCDIPPLMCLLCSNSHIHELSVLVAATLAIAVPFFLIAASYAFIVNAVLKIKSAAGRQRAFSTCSSHLMVVLLQYGCCAFMYLRPKSSFNPKKDQFVSLIYIFGTPLLNPLIYTLRNNEMKGTLGKILSRKCHLRNN
ncbi:olfactory receptor 10W1-like [Suncus etruscus]|uniref:olfactory receptor 10W1-like n=1 Tax=Suncus etruscus TaxID=109475 RepID=UPI00211054D0|nr:olfactory receptor 10W1-like [Suncus etruscus]